MFHLCPTLDAIYRHIYFQAPDSPTMEVDLGRRENELREKALRSKIVRSRKLSSGAS